MRNRFKSESAIRLKTYTHRNSPRSTGMISYPVPCRKARCGGAHWYRTFGVRQEVDLAHRRCHIQLVLQHPYHRNQGWGRDTHSTSVFAPGCVLRCSNHFVRPWPWEMDSSPCPTTHRSWMKFHFHCVLEPRSCVRDHQPPLNAWTDRRCPTTYNQHPMKCFLNLRNASKPRN